MQSLIKKILSAISRILFSLYQGTKKAVIYLAATLLLQSCCLPSPVFAKAKYERAARLLFSPEVYVALQHAKFTRRHSYLHQL